MQKKWDRCKGGMSVETDSWQDVFQKFWDFGVDIRLFTAFFLSSSFEKCWKHFFRKLFEPFEKVLFALTALAAILTTPLCCMVITGMSSCWSSESRSHVKTVSIYFGFDNIPLDVTIVHC